MAVISVEQSVNLILTCAALMAVLLYGLRVHRYFLWYHRHTFVFRLVSLCLLTTAMIGNMVLSTASVPAGEPCHAFVTWTYLLPLFLYGAMVLDVVWFTGHSHSELLKQDASFATDADDASLAAYQIQLRVSKKTWATRAVIAILHIMFFVTVSVLSSSNAGDVAPGTYCTFGVAGNAARMVVALYVIGVYMIMEYMRKSARQYIAACVKMMNVDNSLFGPMMFFTALVFLYGIESIVVLAVDRPRAIAEHPVTSVFTTVILLISWMMQLHSLYAIGSESPMCTFGPYSALEMARAYSRNGGVPTTRAVTEGVFSILGEEDEDEQERENQNTKQGVGNLKRLPLPPPPTRRGSAAIEDGNESDAVRETEHFDFDDTAVPDDAIMNNFAATEVAARKHDMYDFFVSNRLFQSTGGMDDDGDEDELIRGILDPRRVREYCEAHGLQELVERSNFTIVLERELDTKNATLVLDIDKTTGQTNNTAREAIKVALVALSAHEPNKSIIDALQGRLDATVTGTDAQVSSALRDVQESLMEHLEAMRKTIYEDIIVNNSTGRGEAYFYFLSESQEDQ